MTTVVIIGAGEIGGAVADALARINVVDRVILVDHARQVAVGKALDIFQAGAITHSRTRVEGTDEIEAAAGCDVCIIADPAAHDTEQLQKNGDLAWLTRLASSIDLAPFVFAGHTQAAMLATVSINAGVTAERLVGSGPLAMTAAMTSLVAMEAHCSPREVSLVVLGTLPDNLVVPWSQSALAGFSIERVLTPPQIRRLEARMAKLWPLGPYALGIAAARATEAILTTSRAAVSILSMLDGPFGVRSRVGTIPALLSRGGIAQVLEPQLSSRERIQVHTALDW
jgi:malate dehydrogenase